MDFYESSKGRKPAQIIVFRYPYIVLHFLSYICFYLHITVCLVLKDIKVLLANMLEMGEKAIVLSVTCIVESSLILFLRYLTFTKKNL